jgi:hypothetical protein
MGHWVHFVYKSDSWQRGESSFMHAVLLNVDAQVMFHSIDELTLNISISSLTSPWLQVTFQRSVA